MPLPTPDQLIELQRRLNLSGSGSAKKYGTVDKVSIIKDKFSGQSKGFGFVEMAKQAEAEEAIKQLNGNAMGGRNITVNVARPRTEGSDRPRGGGGGKRW